MRLFFVTYRACDSNFLWDLFRAYRACGVGDEDFGEHDAYCHEAQIIFAAGCARIKNKRVRKTFTSFWKQNSDKNFEKYTL